MRDTVRVNRAKTKPDSNIGLSRRDVGWNGKPRSGEHMLHSTFPCAPVAQLDRAAGFEPVGRGFESLRAHQIKQIAGWQDNPAIHRAPVAQLDRALASEAKGRAFESPRAHQPSLAHTGAASVPVQIHSFVPRLTHTEWRRTCMPAKRGD